MKRKDIPERHIILAPFDLSVGNDQIEIFPPAFQKWK